MTLGGNLVYQQNSNKEFIEKVHESIGNKNHEYYKKEINSLHGPAGVAGLYDVFSTGLMWYFVPSAAPTTNFLVALADYLQVHIARTKLFGDPNVDSESGQIAKQRRVGAMAWTQVLAGAGGIGSFVTEAIFGENDDGDLSTGKKSLLSLSSLVAASTMLTTYSEKMVVATTSKGKKVGNEIKGIVLDANNDIRAALEYVAMAIYPWVTSIKSIKKAIDLAVPILAIRDGLGNFISDGISTVFTNKPNIQFPEKLGSFLKYALFIFTNGKNGKRPFSHVSLPKPLAQQWFLGEGNFRDRYLVPIFSALGCKTIPKVNMEGENGSRALVVKYPIGELPSEYEIDNPKILKFEDRLVAAL